MEIVYDETDLERYMTEAVKVSRKHPVLIDDFLENAVEIDVDAVSDGKDVLIGAIMEHIEEAGIHSGDSACVIPPQSLSPAVQDEVRKIVRKIALRLHVVGCVNLQMAYKSRNVYVLEANPRSSRTIPFVTKATGVPLAKIAAKAIIGCSLKELGYTEEPQPKHVSVKEVVLPFDKLPGADPILGPEMKSTGEVMGIDVDFGRAYFKAELSAFNSLPQEGTVFISVRDEDKPEIVRIARILRDNGLELIGTEGTKTFLEANGIQVQLMSKIYEGSPNVTDLMREGKVSPDHQHPDVQDGPQGRRHHPAGRRRLRGAVCDDDPGGTCIGRCHQCHGEAEDHHQVAQRVPCAGQETGRATRRAATP